MPPSLKSGGVIGPPALLLPPMSIGDRTGTTRTAAIFKKLQNHEDICKLK